MEARLASKFAVLGDNQIVTTETRRDLTALVASLVGDDRYSSSSASRGQIVEITISLKTTSDPKWVACPLLGYYSTSQCGTWNPPQVACRETHFHRPKWNDADPPTCETCTSLGITPSRDADASDVYNHSNTGA